MTIGMKILYYSIVTLSILLGIIFIWLNLHELIERSLGHDTYFSQMYSLTDKESIWYSIIFLIPSVSLMVLEFYYLIKKKTKQTIICVVFFLLILGIQFYTDGLFIQRI